MKESFSFHPGLTKTLTHLVKVVKWEVWIGGGGGGGAFPSNFSCE